MRPLASFPFNLFSSPDFYSGKPVVAPLDLEAVLVEDELELSCASR
jgi:hypothetical protein